jgi:hypothetical protein
MPLSWGIFVNNYPGSTHLAGYLIGDGFTQEKRSWSRAHFSSSKGKLTKSCQLFRLINNMHDPGIARLAAWAIITSG